MKTFLRNGLCVLALATATPGHAEELGRLFFTPQEREMLDRGQHPAVDKPGSADTLTVNGIVQKHGGERIIWINGVRQPAGKSDERSPESTAVAIPGQSRKIRVKVGQKISINPEEQRP